MLSKTKADEAITQASNIVKSNVTEDDLESLREREIQK
jgi:hypothetical protein